MKICSKCKEEKEECEFSKRPSSPDGLRCSCKACDKAYVDNNKLKIKEQKRVNYLQNKTQIAEKGKKYYKDNKNARDAQHKIYVSKNRETIKEYKKKWASENKSRIESLRKIRTEKNKEHIRRYKNRWARAKRYHDSLYKLSINIKALIRSSLRKKGYSKKSRTAVMLGCSPSEFKIHLGSKPAGDWDLDHICPCAQAQNEEELIKLQHYSNFQWLTAFDNRSKKHSVTPDGLKMCKALLNREWIYQGDFQCQC